MSFQPIINKFWNSISPSDKGGINKGMRYFFILFGLIFLGTGTTSAQINEQFDDGDFSSSPTWQGTSSDFTIVGTRKILQLKQSKAGTSFLSTALNLSGNMEFNFLFYSPTLLDKNNYASIYLFSDNVNLNGSLQGYYLKLGTGAGRKSLEFYRQDGITSKLLASGGKNHFSESSTTIRIKMIKDSKGNWFCFSDTTGATNFIPEFSCSDFTYTSNKFFGIKAVTNTSSNVDKMFFDDFIVIRHISDVTPPKISGGAIRDEHSLILQFNEYIDSASASNLKAYFLRNFLVNPDGISIIDQNKALLEFNNTSFIKGNSYTVLTSTVKDFFGNLLAIDSITLSYALPKGFGICINEIYADTLPSYGLPLAEYIELFNYSASPINLRGFEIKDLSTSCKLPNYILKPDSFVVICKNASLYKFKGIENTIGISNFISINNNGEKIFLFDSLGLGVESIFFDMNTYKNTKKNDGGYSLERINPSDTCLGSDNFTASNATIGGTPGRVNSVYLQTVDYTPPSLLIYKFLDDSSLYIKFSEKINIYALLTTNFTINGLRINKILIDSNYRNVVILSLIDKAKDNTKYTLITNNILDCAGNSLNSVTKQVTFIYTSKLDKNQILFSEIMFRQTDGQQLPKHDYIEVFNSSLVAKRLIGLQLYNKGKYFSFPDVVLDSGEYAIICDEKYEKEFAIYGKTVPMKSFPGIYNELDTFIMLSDSSKYPIIVDKMFFNSNTGFQTSYKKYGGFSLERDDIYKECLSKTEWLESNDSLGGTPGKANSVHIERLDPDIYAKKFQILKIKDSSILIKIPEYLNLDSNLLLHFGQNELGINSIKYLNLFGSQILILFNNPLKIEKIYDLIISDIPICGTLNDKFSENLTFGLPSSPSNSEIVFNEILFKASTSDAGFYEIFNNTESKFFNLKNVLLKGFADDGALIYAAGVTSDDYYLAPQQYLALSRNILGVKNDFPNAPIENLIKSDYFPLYNLNNGSIELRDTFNKKIDNLPLFANWHSPFITDIKGISLEKLAENLKSDEKSNWQSASISEGYGSPGLKNGQSITNTSVKSKKYFNASSSTLSPDGDGFEDFVTFNYSLPKNGYALRVKLFSEVGVFLGQIINGDILNGSGYLKWEGEVSGKKLSAGNYILLFDGLKDGESPVSEKIVLSVLYR